MKILFLSDNYFPERNAGATRVYERALYWARWGHQVTVITCCPNFPEGQPFEGYENHWFHKEFVDGIEVVRVKTFMAANRGTVLRILDFLSFMVSSFVFGLFLRGHDVVVASSPQFFTAVSGWGLAFVKRKPFIFELADLWPASVKAVGAMKESWALRCVEQVELFLYRQASYVIALTYAFKDELSRRGISADKIAVIRNGAELNKYRPLSKDSALTAELGLENKFVVGYIGTLGLAHDLDKVLDVAQMTLEKFPEIHYLFVGPGAARESLIARCISQKLTNVHFVHSQPKDLIPKYWSLCDIALVHLKNDPVFETVIPSKIFEAMAMGKPILLVAPPGESQKIIEDEDVGLWVRAGDPEQMKGSLLELFSNKEKLLKFGIHSFERSMNHSREKQAFDYIEILKSAQ